MFHAQSTSTVISGWSKLGDHVYSNNKNWNKKAKTVSCSLQLSSKQRWRKQWKLTEEIIASLTDHGLKVGEKSKLLQLTWSTKDKVQMLSGKLCLVENGSQPKISTARCMTTLLKTLLKRKQQKYCMKKQCSNNFKHNFQTSVLCVYSHKACSCAQDAGTVSLFCIWINSCFNQLQILGYYKRTVGTKNNWELKKTEENVSSTAESKSTGLYLVTGKRQYLATRGP